MREVGTFMVFQGDCTKNIQFKHRNCTPYFLINHGEFAFFLHILKMRVFSRIQRLDFSFHEVESIV